MPVPRKEGTVRTGKMLAASNRLRYCGFAKRGLLRRCPVDSTPGDRYSPGVVICSVIRYQRRIVSRYREEKSS